MANETQSADDPAPAGGTRSDGVRRVLRVVLVLNVLVLAVKLVVGVRTHALAVLGAALESGLDTLTNVLGMALVAIAARGPDEDHPYGHAKFETVGTIGIAGFLSISCFELLRESVTSLIRARAPHPASAVDLGVMAVTLAVNAGIVWYERRAGRRLGSAFLAADAAHTASDIFVTLLAVASLVLTRAGAPRADALLGIAVAALIAWTGWQILRQSVPILVDARAIEAEELRRIAGAIPGILGVRAVRSRAAASGHLFVEMTIVVSGAWSVEDAHALADALEREVERAAGRAEVVVHVEPD
ncbi:MAG: cation transporter [Gemmatimonadota bacterium]|nr:cation transporter [Gemmatimonadota bacterium]